jgi:hypothetical protein
MGVRVLVGTGVKVGLMVGLVVGVLGEVVVGEQVVQTLLVQAQSPSQVAPLPTTQTPLLQ